MKVKEEKTITPEKISMLKDYDTVIQRVIAESKREVENLNVRRENLIIANAQLDQELVRKQSQFDQWKRLEEQKIADMQNKAKNDILRREKQFEVGELDFSRRIAEIERREEIGKRVVEKEAKLNNERIEVEKLRSNANLLNDEANRKLSDANSKYSHACIMEAKAKELEKKASAINDAIVKREHDVSEKEKDIASQLKNMKEVKEIIEPKLKELSIAQEKLDKEKKELAEKEQIVLNKHNEYMVVIKDLGVREAKIKEREKQLDQKDAEITRKALLAGVKSV